jgi:hypothetical protein
VVRASYELAVGLAFLVVAQVPLDEEILSLGVAVHSFTIASELGIVWWQEAQTGVDAVDEGLDLLFVTEDHAALPVRGDGAEVDDLDGAPYGVALLRITSVTDGFWDASRAVVFERAYR